MRSMSRRHKKHERGEGKKATENKIENEIAIMQMMQQSMNVANDCRVHRALGVDRIFGSRTNCTRFIELKWD